jgi:dephospho-CoA kinase
MKRRIIGITGGIGSGKSEVTAYLRRKGERVICADEVARQVVRPGSRGAEAVRSVFGDGFFLPGGALNRAKLAQRVFGDANALERLNAALHPVILEEIWAQASCIQGRVFIDAALLVETGMHKKVDAVWLITADRETRIQRVMLRDDASREAVEKRMEGQTDDESRMNAADEVIDNSQDISDLHRKIDALLKAYGEE